MGVFKKGGSWYIDYYHSGKRIRENVGPSKKDAVRALQTRKGEINQGRFNWLRKKDSPPFDSFAQEFLRLGSTNKRDVWSIKPLTEYLGKRRLGDIGVKDLTEYRQMRLRTVSVATVNRELACLRHVFNVAAKWGRMPKGENPVQELGVGKEESRVVRFLAEEEEARLLVVCGEGGARNGHLRPIILTALHTGMRLREILYLRWRQVDFAERNVVACATKTHRERIIPMNDTLRSVLLGQWEQALYRGPDEFVFCNRKGKPYHSIRTSFGRALRRARIKSFRFHDLRHTFASRLVMSGADLPTVKELLGHKSLAMTMRYAHLSDQHKRGAVELLDGHNLDTIRQKVGGPVAVSARKYWRGGRDSNSRPLA